jgi:hypothetical protein
MKVTSPKFVHQWIITVTNDIGKVSNDTQAVAQCSDLPIAQLLLDTYGKRYAALGNFVVLIDKETGELTFYNHKD